jgi:hypothetical protein
VVAPVDVGFGEERMGAALGRKRGREDGDVVMSCALLLWMIC